MTGQTVIAVRTASGELSPAEVDSLHRLAQRGYRVELLSPTPVTAEELALAGSAVLPVRAWHIPGGGCKAVRLGIESVAALLGLGHGQQMWREFRRSGAQLRTDCHLLALDPGAVVFCWNYAKDAPGARAWRAARPLLDWPASDLSVGASDV